MKDTLILYDGSIIELESGASLSDMKVLSVTKENMIFTWNQLTKNNLKQVQIKNGDGLVVATYDNLVLDWETSKENKDGSIITSFNLRQKTEIELLREEVDAIKDGQDIQDEAIADVGVILNDLTGGV